MKNKTTFQTKMYEFSMKKKQTILFVSFKTVLKFH